MHPSKLDRNWTPLEIEIAKRIYSRPSVAAGGLNKREFDPNCLSSRQMTRALVDARTAINGLTELGYLKREREAA